MITSFEGLIYREPIFKNLIDMGFDFSFRLVFFVLVVITASIAENPGNVALAK
jgi:hypothetical protein